jgi:energy-coupling factor transport system permease protein
LLCCIGAANALANPKRALRVLPAAVYELGVAVIVCMTVAPQLVESVQRVRKARRLRAGRTAGLWALGTIAVPVLEDALDRSIQLAASMDSRGYGRVGSASAAQRRGTAALLLAGMVGLSAGVYGLLGSDNPPWLGTPALVVGIALCVGGLWLGGRRISRSAYRPDPWRLPEWLVAGSGIATAALLIAVGHRDAAALSPSLYPISWPALPGIPLLAILLGAVPALLAPPPVRRAVATRRVEVAPEPIQLAA